MSDYVEALYQRQQAAADEDGAWVQHFGRKGEDCENWPRLFADCAHAELSNSSCNQHLPRDEDGYVVCGWFDSYGNGIAYGPSIYSNKFPYVLAKSIAGGGPRLISMLSDIIEKADAIDCNYLIQVIGNLTTYLSNHSLRLLNGQGYSPVIIENIPAKLFYENWSEEQTGSQLFICQLGIAIPGNPVIPASVAMNALKMVLRQVKAKQRVITHTNLPAHSPLKAFLPTARTLPVDNTPPQAADSFANTAASANASIKSLPYERLPIDEALSISRADLDQVLLEATLIELDAITDRYKAKPRAKPWQWANVRAALREKLMLAEISDLEAAQLFNQTYDAKVSRGTMQQRPQKEQNRKVKTRRMIAYAEFILLLDKYRLQ